MTPIPSSFAIFAIVSVFRPGIVSAMSNRAQLVDLQKYGALKSSLRHTICAPRCAASLMRGMVASIVSRTSDVAASCTRPTVNGELDIRENKLAGSFAGSCSSWLFDDTYRYVHH